MWMLSAIKGTVLAQVRSGTWKGMREDPKMRQTPAQFRVNSYNESQTGERAFSPETLAIICGVFAIIYPGY